MEFITTELGSPVQKQKIENIKHHKWNTSKDIIHAISMRWKGKAKEGIIIEDIYESIELGHSQQEIIDTLQYLFNQYKNQYPNQHPKKKLCLVKRLISYSDNFREFQKSISHKENFSKVFDIMNRLEKILIRYKNRESDKEDNILKIKLIESGLEMKDKHINGLISSREHKVRENQTLTLQDFNYKDFSPIDTYYAIYTIMHDVIHTYTTYKYKYDQFFAYLDGRKMQCNAIDLSEIIDEITFVIKNKKGIRY